MGKQANIRNMTVTAHSDSHGKSMLQDFLIREAGIIHSLLRALARDLKQLIVWISVSLSSHYHAMCKRERGCVIGATKVAVEGAGVS